MSDKRTGVALYFEWPFGDGGALSVQLLGDLPGPGATQDFSDVMDLAKRTLNRIVEEVATENKQLKEEINAPVSTEAQRS